MLNFIKEYWQVIAATISLVVSIVIWCLKKKPTINELSSILLAVMNRLPDIINSVELLNLPGNEKKALVLTSIKQMVQKQFSINLPVSILASLGERIEDILSTPQKKEVSI